jgi:uncharacterized damage-inducible protein DinB
MTSSTASHAPVNPQEWLERFIQSPQRLRRTLEDVSGEELKARPIEGKWSIQEIVHHMADSELVGGVRIRLVLAQSGLPLPGYEQDEWATELDYQHRDAAQLEASLRLFEATRAALAYLFAQASPDDWQKHGIHPKRGPLSLRQLLELYTTHAENHLTQIEERKRLLAKAA